MTRMWADRLSADQSGDLRRLYTEVPDLSGITVRHVRLLRLGPGLVVRFDLPSFPDRAPSGWAGLDRLQCHLMFLAVDHVSLDGDRLPAIASMSLSDLAENRIAVEVTGAVRLSFTASAVMRLGRISAYRDSEAEHHFLGRLERARFTTVPGAEAEAFHERF